MTSNKVSNDSSSEEEKAPPPAYTSKDDDAISKTSNTSKSSSNSSEAKDTVDDLPLPDAGFFLIYKNHTSALEKLALLIAILCAAGHGTMLPFLFVLFGDMTTDFTTAGQLKECDYDCNKCVEVYVYNGTCECLPGDCPFYEQFLPMDDIFGNEDLYPQCFPPTLENARECAQGLSEQIRNTFVESQIGVCIRYGLAGVIVLVLGTIHAGIFK